MTDKGIVISAGEDFAEVEVSCLEGCHDCSARSLCIGNKRKKGHLSVKNPLHANPGDTVKIQIPEDRYSLALIQIFGGLLSALLVGMGGGYLFSLLLDLSSYSSSFIGLIIGLVVGGFVLARIFRGKNKKNLYPVIVGIIKKGGCYGSA